MKQDHIESTPELEHVAALLLNGMLSNPALVTPERMAEKNLNYFAGKAIKAAQILEKKLSKEREQG